MPDNQVNVNHDELAAEGAAIPLPPDATPPSGAAPGPAPAPGTIDQAPPGELAPVESWASTTPSLVFLVDRLVVPNWKLTDDEKRDLGDALVPVLDDLFPGGLGSEKWAPYFRLVAVTGMIAVARIEDGKLKPLRAPRDDDQAKAAHDVERGPFTTAAPSGSH